MGINYIIMQALSSVVIGVIGVYLYLSNKRTNIKMENGNKEINSKVENIKNEVKNHIVESQENYKILIKENKVVVSKIDHDNGNLKLLGNNIYLFHQETDTKLEEIKKTQEEIKQLIRELKNDIK